MLFVDFYWLFPLIAVAIFWIWTMVTYPKVWLATSTLSLTYFLVSNSIGISVTELALAGFYLLTILVWLIIELSRDYRQIIRSWPDFLLLLFIFSSIGNSLVAVTNGVPIHEWTSEWSLFIMMLYVFPIRKYFSVDDKSVKQFLVILGISVCIMSVQSILNYRSRLAEGGAVYAYQIWSGRSVLLGPAFQCGMVFSMVYFFFVKRKGKVFSAAVFLITSAALIATFTRTLWASFFICLAIAVVLLGIRRATILISSIVTVAVVGYGGFALYKPKLAAIALTVVKNRISSSTQLSGGDFSFETRLTEVRNITPKIKALPLGGNGIRSKYVTWQTIAGMHARTPFIHIGYASILYKLGIPLSILLLLTISSYFFSAIVASWDFFRTRERSIYTAMAYSLTAYFPALLITIFTTGFFDTRYGNAIFGIMFACCAIVHNYARNRPAPLPNTITPVLQQ